MNQCLVQDHCGVQIQMLIQVVALLQCSSILLLLLLHSTVKYDNLQAEYIKYLTTHKNGFKKLYF